MDDEIQALDGSLRWLDRTVEDLEEKVENVENIATRLEEIAKRLEGARNTSKPTEKQVREYMRTCNERTLREDVAREQAREFINYNDKRGWKNKSGEAITRWKYPARGWVRMLEKSKGESIYEK